METENAENGPRLLVVDDLEDHRLLLGQLLAQLPVAVDLAKDGPGAIIATSTTRYDLVLMDLVMPGMDGFQVIKALRGTGCTV